MSLSECRFFFLFPVRYSIDGDWSGNIEEDLKIFTPSNSNDNVLLNETNIFFSSMHFSLCRYYPKKKHIGIGRCTISKKRKKKKEREKKRKLCTSTIINECVKTEEEENTYPLWFATTILAASLAICEL